MRTLPLALAAAIVAAVGCSSNRDQVLVEQEARMFEDEVYHLEAQLDECCRAKEAAQRESEDLRRQLADGGAPSYRAPAVDSTPRSTPPARREGPKLEPPTIELPESSDTPPANLIPGDEQPAVEGVPKKLSINKRLTGGLDRDGSAGDEGILVMVEPRDERGQLVKTPGAVSLVLMDPSQTGDEARVARWDFQAHEFDDHFRHSTFGRGLQYELKWPDEPPQNRDLVLFVRYIADDGTKLTADAPVHVRMASDAPPETKLAEHEERDDDRRTAEPDVPRTSRDDRQARGDKPEWSPFR